MWRMNGDTAAQAPTGTDHSAQGGAGLPSPRSPGSPLSWRERLARHGYRARPTGTLTERLVPPMPDGPGVTEPGVPQSPVLLRLGITLPQGLWYFLCRWSGWLGPIAVAVFAGLLRFTNLGQPHAIIFDETYYAKDAYALWQGGYEINWPEDANTTIMTPGAAVPYRSTASYVVHPPVGKWIIGAGEQLFGMNPFGWRFAVALLGTLSVLMLARIARRMFRSTLLGCVAGLLLSVDGLHLVLSRTALLDLVVMFWMLAAFGFLLLDRDHTRGRLAARLGGVADPARAQRLNLGWRPYRIAAGVCVGLTCATKWSGLYVAAAFGVLTVLWDVGARRLAGAPRPYLAVLARDVVPAFVSVVVVSVTVYLASWWGWFASSNAPGRGGWGRDWAVGRSTDYPWIPEGLRALWHYHSTVYEFHTHLTDPHTYQSNPWSWLVLGRPVSFYYESPKFGQDGCTVSDCAREVLGIGTPLLWWTAVLALVYCLWRWAFRRDWRAGALLCGLAAGYLPWFLYQQRTIFLFYAVVFVPFLVLAVTMLIGALIGPAGASRDRRIIGSATAGLLVLLIMWNFLYFFPLFTGQTIPLEDWRARMWFNSWI
ncbi:Dolichyl-phosphate-mannose--protein mannosyltransferase OS=Kitasatospora aureofaciens OX=1894 GN=GCM10010502_39860 PE=3 SV=1 [Kitasatospora aureofaciens]|uniref:Polyprenol-phosphate-mannose--protein mannosyltransferase n=2 Tax=Kitasatospora aureofaciens TaxID=1894 RepID=A0A8H9HT06_KITAU|nr:phospholipid carrier-dependent glycosyltransferase [Kitasatospora aureofaciens]